MSQTKIAVFGCAGRMGQNLLRVADENDACAIVGAGERPGHDWIGQDIGTLLGLSAEGVTVVADPVELFKNADIVIDFTTPDATVANAKLAADTSVALIAGTTGLSHDQEAAIAEAATKTAIMRAANFSVGVNLLEQLTKRAASILGDDFDIEILEMHHKHKVDAPSGTALMLGYAAADGRQVSHEEVAVRGRDGITSARNVGDIGYAVLRGGNVAGEHTVMFATEDERIELTHKATDRVIFAKGAIRAALWTEGQAPGLYSMLDVLGFTD
jgi:4-hydroxy-tetrahydrodipicolinate reductase